MLGDVESLLNATRRNGFGSILVQLESPGSFDTFRKALTQNPALNVDIERQSEFYNRTSGGFTIFMATLAYVLGTIMAVGALFGTLNIMYSAVRARAVEIATLRALGFGAAPVAVSVVAEAVVLAITGALIGAAVALVIFNGKAETQRTYVFQLLITPGMVGLGLSWALVIAFLGSAFPAIRASRLSIATALRGA
jgi:putative ABC transport system permease protein